MSAITKIEEDWDHIGPVAVAESASVVKCLRELEHSPSIRVSDRWKIEEAADMVETLADYARYIAVCYFRASAGNEVGGAVDRVTCDQAKLSRPEKYCRMGRCENEEMGGQPCILWNKYKINGG